MSFELPQVTEMGRTMESVTPLDTFGLENEEWRDWPRKLAENLRLESGQREDLHLSPVSPESNGPGATSSQPDVAETNYTTNEKDEHKSVGRTDRLARHGDTSIIHEKGAEAPNSSGSRGNEGPPVSIYDYTKQLEFHKQEVADAPKRGMPEAQVNYHLGKIAVLERAPGPPPKYEQHQLDCKPEAGSCGCKKG